MLGRYIKNEFIRMIFRWQTAMIYLIFIAVYIHISVLENLDVPRQAEYPIALMLESTNPFIMYLKVLCGPVNSYMPLLFPLLPLITIGNSLYLDKSSSFLPFSLARIDVKSYIRNKIIAASIVTFFMTFLVQVSCLIYSFVTSPYYRPTQVAIEHKIAQIISAPLFIKNPFFYLLLVIVLYSLIASVMAVLGMLASNLLSNNYAVIVVPWSSYMILGIIMIFIYPETSRLLYDFSPIVKFAFVFETHNSSFLIVFFYWSLILILTSFFTYKTFMRKFNEKTV